jgi:peptide/nickel transport system substrate-binding protein
VGKSDLAQKNPLGKDARVRQAFELSLDRQGIVDVAQDGEALPGNQWVAPNNAWYAKNVPIPKRDVEKAKALLKEAGVPNPSFTLMTATTADAQRVAQVVQAMAKEAGFDVKIQLTEFATSLDEATKGNYEAYVLAWSGRPDPDGNLQAHLGCNAPLNYAGWCNKEANELIDKQRVTIDRGERQKLFDQIAAFEAKDLPIVYLYHRHWLWAYTNKLTGFRTVPDGIIRIQGMKM